MDDAPPRDDSRFDEKPQAHHGPGYDAAPPGWADPVAQWSAEQADPEDIVHFAGDDEVEFAPPRYIAAVDDAPALAPDDIGEDAAAADDAPPAAPGTTGMPDFFEVQRRRVARLRLKKQEKTGLLTPARLIVAMTALIAVLLFERVNIVRLMPQTATLYAAVGLPINLRGLVFEDVKTTTEMQDSVPVLVIEGTVRSVARDMADVPRLRFAMRNAAGADIYSWTAVPERTQLGPGQLLTFRTRLASPPPESRSAYVRFVQRRDFVAANQ